jgi:RNA polymerase sigma-70 factor (ECF subfamily)
MMLKALENQQNHIEDPVLLAYYRTTGEGHWMGMLLERYSIMVLGVCMKYLKNRDDAQDATQQVFEKAIVECRKYEVPYFKSWIYSIAKNHCLMKLRKDNSTVVLKEELPETPDESEWADQSPFLLATAKEKKEQLLHDALKALPMEQQECLDLFYLQNKSYQEIQLITGMNFGQVKSHIQNGKRRLKIMLEKSEDHVSQQ